jgi:hypothetical protein
VNHDDVVSHPMSFFGEGDFRRHLPRPDWLDHLRGQLPKLMPPSRAHVEDRAIGRLFWSSVRWGLATGSVTGAVTATSLLIAGGPFALFAAVPGGIVGFVVALPLALVVAGAISLVAAKRHSPLQDPTRLHRDIWRIFVATLALLDAPAVGLIATARSANGRLFGSLITAIATLVVVLMLRRAGRGIAVVYAEASGWLSSSPIRL